MARWNNVTARDLQRVVTTLSLENTGHGSRENRYWYVLDGKKLFKITFPNVHGGGQSVSIGFVNNIVDNLRLNREQWADLLECPMSAEDFAAHIRELKARGMV